MLKKILHHIVFKSSESKLSSSFHSYFYDTIASTKTLTINNKVNIFLLPKFHSEELGVQIDNYLQSQCLNNKKLLICSDSSYNIGINRNFGYKYLQENEYKGIQPPDDLVFNLNPDLPESFDQTILVPQPFYQTNLDSPKSPQSTEKQEQQQDSQQLIVKPVQVVASDLINEYGIQPKYLPFILNNLLKNQQIYIVGLSDLFSRKIIVDTVPLELLKSQFIDFLKFTKAMKDQDDSWTGVTQYGREFLLMTHPKLLQRQAMLLYLIMNQMNQQCTIIGDLYLTENLEILRKDLQDNVNIKKSSSFRQFLFSKNQFQDNDEILLQKHSILEAMLDTDLWSKKFINNMFPYISQNYNKLNQQQQKTIKQRYLFHLNRYKSAVVKFLGLQFY